MLEVVALNRINRNEARHESPARIGTTLNRDYAIEDNKETLATENCTRVHFQDIRMCIN